MTPLLNGQAVNVAFASTKVTSIFGSIFFSVRAQLAPAKPPPTTTTRGAACANAGMEMSAADAAVVERKARRVLRCLFMAWPSLLRFQPYGDGTHLVVGEAFGDAVHHGRRLCAGAERGDQRDDGVGGAAINPRHRADGSAHGMTAGARCGARRRLRRRG